MFTVRPEISASLLLYYYYCHSLGINIAINSTTHTVSCRWWWHGDRQLLSIRNWDWLIITINIIILFLSLSLYYCPNPCISREGDLLHKYSTFNSLFKAFSSLLWTHWAGKSHENSILNYFSWKITYQWQPAADESVIFWLSSCTHVGDAVSDNQLYTRLTVCVSDSLLWSW